MREAAVAVALKWKYESFESLGNPAKAIGAIAINFKLPWWQQSSRANSRFRMRQSLEYGRGPLALNAFQSSLLTSHKAPFTLTIYLLNS